MATKPVTRAHPGELPVFWDRSVIFFANLLSMFYGNEQQTAELASHVGGINSYGGRLIPILNILFRGGNNMLVLERAPNPDLLSYFTSELKLELPDIEVLHDKAYMALTQPVAEGAEDEISGIRERIRGHAASWIDGFVTDQRLMGVARGLERSTVSRSEGSRRGNNKLLLHQYLQDREFPVFETELAESADDVMAILSRLRDKGHLRAALKAQIGASGFGMLIVSTTPAEPVDVPAYMFFEGPCLVQGWLDEEMEDVRFIGSPSVQMFVDDESVNLYDLTDQVLSAESIHEGNLSPPHSLATRARAREQLLEQAGAAGQWLHSQGYRGTASADGLLIEWKGKEEVRICEVNARVTGATYPSVLARFFMPHGAWLMRNLRFRAVLDGGELLTVLRESGCLYRPGQPTGVLPINLNPGEDEHIAKGQFLCLGPTVSACEDVLDHAESVTPVDWMYDRD